MRILCLSDLHGDLLEWPYDSRPDVITISGDICPDGTDSEQERWVNEHLMPWFRVHEGCPFVFVAGNHDFILQKKKFDWPANAIYLEDSGAEVNGIRFYGTPWQMDPKCRMAFSCSEQNAEAFYNKIPSDTQVLLTHQVPLGWGSESFDVSHPGSPSLLTQTEGLKDLKLHAFGHVHYTRGVNDTGTFMQVNASNVFRRKGMLIELGRRIPREIRRDMIVGRYVYERVGHGSREVTLELSWHVGIGTARCERCWRHEVDERGNTSVNIINQDGEITMRLYRSNRQGFHLYGWWQEHDKCRVNFYKI